MRKRQGPDWNDTKLGKGKDLTGIAQNEEKART
jgi:hypothetical protein